MFYTGQFIELVKVVKNIDQNYKNISGIYLTLDRNWIMTGNLFIILYTYYFPVYINKYCIYQVCQILKQIPIQIL